MMASAAPAVTAILVNYFGHADIAQAVLSLQADVPDLDIIVVDNSKHAEEAAALQTALSLAKPVTVLTAPDNLGFGQACNWAAAMRPEAAFYWLVNPDVRVLPGCLAALLEAMEAHPRLGAVAPLQFLDQDQTLIFSPSWRPTALGMWASEVAQRQPRAWQRYTAAVGAESRRVLQAKQDNDRGKTVAPLPQRALSGAIVLLRRQALAQIGGLFDPRYFMYYEDSDLCLRLRRGGWGMALVPYARALHLWTMGGHKAGLMAQAAPVYFNTHFAHSRWMALAAHAAQQPGWIHPHHPLWPQAQHKLVPTAWQRGWMLELSPQPLLLPSVLLAGEGTRLEWPKAALAAVQGAPLWARLSPLNAQDAAGFYPSLWWRWTA